MMDAALFYSMFPTMVDLGKSAGWLLTLSKRNNLVDVIAIPWTAVPDEPQTLLDTLKKQVGIKVAETSRECHGRINYTMAMPGGEFDLSFTPRFYSRWRPPEPNRCYICTKCGSSGRIAPDQFKAALKPAAQGRTIKSMACPNEKCGYLVHVEDVGYDPEQLTEAYAAGQQDMACKMDHVLAKIRAADEKNKGLNISASDLKDLADSLRKRGVM